MLEQSIEIHKIILRLHIHPKKCSLTPHFTQALLSLVASLGIHQLYPSSSQQETDSFAPETNALLALFQFQLIINTLSSLWCKHQHHSLLTVVLMMSYFSTTCIHDSLEVIKGCCCVLKSLFPCKQSKRGGEKQGKTCRFPFFRLIMMMVRLIALLLLTSLQQLLQQLAVVVVQSTKNQSLPNSTTYTFAVCKSKTVDTCRCTTITASDAASRFSLLVLASSYNVNRL